MNRVTAKSISLSMLQRGLRRAIGLPDNSKAVITEFCFATGKTVFKIDVSHLTATEIIHHVNATRSRLFMPVDV